MQLYLVQSGVLGYERLLDLTKSRHAAYCTLHSYHFRCFTERTRTDREGNWDGVDRIVQVLEEAAPGDLVIHLDADSIIKDFPTPLSSAMQDWAHLGMVPSNHIDWLKLSRPNFDFEGWDKKPQYISGGSWTRKTDATLALWKEVQRRGPVYNPMGWKVQATLMQVLSELPPASLLLEPLHPMWFCQPYHPTAFPVVVHPIPGTTIDTKARLLTQFLADLPLPEPSEPSK